MLVLLHFVVLPVERRADMLLEDFFRLLMSDVVALEVGVMISSRFFLDMDFCCLVFAIISFAKTTSFVNSAAIETMLSLLTSP